jgi:tetratricopeptide (TPR) repeat protein
MTFDKVMEKINSQLTGDPEKDREFLSTQMEEYKRHKFSKEIMRAILRMLFELAPDELKEKFAQIADNRKVGVESTVEEANFQCFKKDFKGALKTMEPLIKRIDEKREAGYYVDDDKNEYRGFYNSLERNIYEVLYSPAKHVHQIDEDFAGAYLCYGRILVELHEYDNAILALEKALLYNPVAIEVLFALSEIHRLKGSWYEYLKLNKQCFDCAYSSNALANCYKNLGLYYNEKEEHIIATALFYISLDYAPGDKVAQSELFYIAEKTGKRLPSLAGDDIFKTLEEQDIQIGPNPLVLHIATSLAADRHKSKDLVNAVYYYKICYDLIEAESIKKILDEIEDGLIQQQSSPSP